MQGDSDRSLGDAQLVYLGRIEKHLATIKSCLGVLTVIAVVVAVQAAGVFAR
jgi:hypothetical protein